MPKTRHEIDRSAKITELLDIAERLFNERGYAGTTTAALAGAAGVAQNAVYWYFPSKDHLFVAVLDRMLDNLIADIRAAGRRPLVDQVLYAAERLERTQDLNVAVLDRARKSEIVAGFGPRIQTALRTALFEAVTRQGPTADAGLVADSILALARGTHGMPRQPRRKLLTFALNRLLVANK